MRLLQGFVNDMGILKRFLSFVYLSDYFCVRVLEGFVDYIIRILKRFLSFVSSSDYFCVRVLLLAVLLLEGFVNHMGILEHFNSFVYFLVRIPEGFVNRMGICKSLFFSFCLFI